MPPIVTFRLSIVFAGAALLAGCAAAFHPKREFTPGPSGAFAAVPLSRQRAAVLAGSDDAKAVFVVDLETAQVRSSFGITKEATGLAAETPEGPLLVTVASRTLDGKPVGSVERWTLGGDKLEVTPMPAQAMAITRVVDGTAFVLIGDDKSRAAIPLTVPALAAGKAIPLDADTRYVAACKSGGGQLLVYASRQGVISARTVGTGQIARSKVFGSDPVCFDGDARIYAISEGFLARSINVLGVPDMTVIASVAASSDLVGIYPADDGSLLALNAGDKASNLQRFYHERLTPVPSASP